MRIYALMLFLHLVAVVIWVGGMFLMHFGVRPAVATALEPSQRLPLLTGILRRFFDWVTGAVIVVLASGATSIVIGGGFAVAHPSVRLMSVVGVVMIAVYLYIRLAPFRRLRAAVAQSNWTQASRALATIRALVALNLALGFATIAIATLGRAWT